MKRLLPHNYRHIPAKIKHLASSHKKKYPRILIALEIILFLSFLVTSFFLFNNYALLGKKRALALKALVSWEKEISKYPKYPEAYYNAALYAEAVGERQKALEYVTQALLLNPSFEESIKLQQKLLR